jgi:hypothetical protein
VYLIDHGAALYFHHDWRDVENRARTRFPAIRDHVLLQWASEMPEVDRIARARLSRELFTGILEEVPDPWLVPEPGAPTAAEKRTGYIDY